MISWAQTLGQLRTEIDRYAKIAGDDAPVLDVIQGHGAGDDVQLEMVYVDAAGRIVGTEAEDYRCGADERAAVLIGCVDDAPPPG